jgi:hypothetical protein
MIMKVPKADGIEIYITETVNDSEVLNEAR